MAERSFSPSHAAIGEARRFVAVELVAVPHEVCETARLLVSELCTNAVLHARRDFTVSVIGTLDFLRIEVTDPSDGQPQLAHPTVRDVHGRGLRLVAALSDRWGVDRAPGGAGKSVWFEIDLVPAGGEGPSGCRSATST